ncbi:UNVERIFIED_CONTAM: hypothetical protein GTU68_003256, partial [Idotea baltica]|nr:hypothetical protein [Idotea baltica]
SRGSSSGVPCRDPGSVRRSWTGREFAGSWKYLQDFKTAAEYQMYHALGLIAVGIAGGARSSNGSRPRRSLTVAAWCFVAGILFFSGSLYALVLTKQTWLGAITPIGGVMFIVGWITFAIGSVSTSEKSV